MTHVLATSYFPYQRGNGKKGAFHCGKKSVKGGEFKDRRAYLALVIGVFALPGPRLEQN